jgi:molybdopterin biosynthesis enzyme
MVFTLPGLIISGVVGWFGIVNPALRRLGG